ncbi:hypothetical protein D917_01782 [Trichinella nativa]|uniref:Uncharacterized protein n=1 Tax=Trichinella nativa TaxID=6335 RepID=A0A1Y3EKM1_9BILA|nr:hypothetical protein D917_01782 [Trichinella nativa]
MQITNKCTNNAGQTVDHTKHDGIQWIIKLQQKLSFNFNAKLNDKNNQLDFFEKQNFVCSCLSIGFNNEKTNENNLYGDDDSQQGLWLGCGQCCAAAFGQ